MGSSMSTTFNAGLTIEDALRQFSAKKRKQIAQIISDGVTLGETTPVISRNIGNTINTLTRRQLDSLVRTITNHTASAARNQIYEANSDVLDGYRFIATLDGRTTLICASNDQKVFPIGAGAPMPPLHWGCRSTTIPAVSPEFDVGSKLHGQRPSVGSTGAKQVSGRTTYGGWLKKQPTEFIDEALGVERSRLFRSGKMTIDKFVDSTGRVYTLKQLESLNPMVFME
jgi:SPP1 gp7 family putative phage head morphogenesis protein